MKPRTGAIISEVIGLIFGWIWVLAIFATPLTLLWAVFGNGKWYYPVITFFVGAFCKAVAREYKNQMESLMYSSSNKDYASEWFALPFEEKKQTIVSSFKKKLREYYPNADIQDWVSYYDENNYFDNLVQEITEGYKETGLKKPYQVVCQTFMDNYMKSIVEQHIEEIRQS